MATHSTLFPFRPVVSDLWALRRCCCSFPISDTTKSSVTGWLSSLTHLFGFWSLNGLGGLHLQTLRAPFLHPCSTDVTHHSWSRFLVSFVYKSFNWHLVPTKERCWGKEPHTNCEAALRLRDSDSVLHHIKECLSSFWRLDLNQKWTLNSHIRKPSMEWFKWKWRVQKSPLKDQVCTEMQ